MTLQKLLFFVIAPAILMLASVPANAQKAPQNGVGQPGSHETKPGEVALPPAPAVPQSGTTRSAADIAPQIPTGVAEGVAAIVNDDVISTYDVKQRMLLMLMSTRVRPTKENLIRFQQQAMRSLVDDHLKLQEAKKYEIEITKDDVDQEMLQLAQQNGVTVASIKNDLSKAGISVHTLKEQMKADLAWQYLVRGKYSTRLRVSNNQLQQEKKRAAANLSKPQYQVSEILLESPSEKDDPQIYAGGLSLIKQMQKGAPFQAVAQQFSAAPSAAKGGDMGWIHAGDLPKEVRTVLQKMKVGSLSSPIKVPGGFYIIALRDKREGGAPMQASFRQIVAPKDKKQAMVAYLETVNTCKAADDITKSVPGALVNPFEKVKLDDLAPAFREILDTLAPNQWSQPVDSPNGAVSVMLCSKGYTEGSGMPSDDEIENRIINKRITMLARRYLRDLRRDSTVEIRQQ